jgi:hypothetical protein
MLRETEDSRKPYNLAMRIRGVITRMNLKSMLCILHEGYQSSLQCWCCLERIAEEVDRSNHPRDINLVNVQTIRNEI